MPGSNSWARPGPGCTTTAGDGTSRDSSTTGSPGRGRRAASGCWAGSPAPALDGLRCCAAIAVICSRYDNFPATVLEAAAMGCPTVAARVGGIPEIIRDGIDGLLHRPGDPDDLAGRIVAMLTDPDRAAEFGADAAARCDWDFHPVAVAERMAAHFRRLTGPSVGGVFYPDTR